MERWERGEKGKYREETKGWKTNFHCLVSMRERKLGGEKQNSAWPTISFFLFLFLSVNIGWNRRENHQPKKLKLKKNIYIYIYIFTLMPLCILVSFFYFFYIFFTYNRNFNLNSHTHIFWRFQGSNSHSHRRVKLFRKGITTRSNTQMTFIFSSLYKPKRGKIYYSFFLFHFLPISKHT